MGDGFSQAPNWIVNDPSELGFAVKLLSEYAPILFFSKKPFPL
jgi:hypothetical protein